MLNSARPASTSRDPVFGPQERIVDVSHGPAHGIALGLSWSLVLWASLAVWFLA